MALVQTVEPDTSEIGASSAPHLSLFDRAMTLRHIASQVASISRAFDRTGNVGMANELSDIADALDTEAAAIQDTAGDIGSRNLHDSQQATGMMLRALMAGSALAHRADAGQASGMTP